MPRSVYGLVGAHRSHRVASPDPAATPQSSSPDACTLCHVVVDALGKTIPAIQTMSALPHRYTGGLCINCHTVKQTTGYPGSGAMNRALAFLTPSPARLQSRRIWRPPARFESSQGPSAGKDLE